MAYTTKEVLNEIATGHGISLAQAAERLPPSREGRPVHKTCLWRWATEGSKASGGRTVHLEAARVGGRLVTTLQALERYMARLSGDVVVDAPPPVRGPTRRERESATAQRRLKEKYRV